MREIAEHIKVVNVRHLDPCRDGDSIVYVGRRYRSWKRSPLGNPFHIGIHGTREEVIEKYEVWLREELKKNSEVKAAILELVNRVKKGEHIRLGCWCHPLPCHAEVIKKIILEYQADPKLEYQADLKAEKKDKKTKGKTQKDMFMDM